MKIFLSEYVESADGTIHKEYDELEGIREETIKKLMKKTGCSKEEATWQVDKFGVKALWR